MADKNFKVKNKISINGNNGNPGPLLINSSNTVSSTPFISTQNGGTGTSTSPNAGQIIYSSSGSSYTATNFTSIPGTYSYGNTASRPSSPYIGQIYINTQTGFMEVYTSAGWSPVAVKPGAPTSVVATNQGSGRAYNNGQASISFTPDSSLGLAIQYNASASPGGLSGISSSSPVIVTGLQSGTSYTFTISATNYYGTSTSQSSGPIIITTVPQAPTIGTATSSSGTTASVSFTPGATGGSAITSYTVTSSPGNITASGASSPITVSNLTTGTAYTFTVTATNANGTSAASAASNSITPANTEFSTTFTYTGADQTFTVPAGITNIKIKCWGAGGGSGLGYGGPGGYSYGELAVTPGTVYTVVVGKGGVLMTQEAGPGTQPYGGGGLSSSRGYAGQGGGLAGVFTGSGAIDFTSSASRTRAVIIAGGSGGGGWTESNSGGGGTTGLTGGGNYGGTGGTQSAPGSNPYNGVSGTQMRGGGGSSGGDGGGAGGGGGGYFGGGSGWNGDSPSGNSCGGGGSGYIGGVTNGTTLQGSGNGSPPNSSDSKYVSPAGAAGVLNQTLSGQSVHQGGNGLVVIYAP